MSKITITPSQARAIILHAAGLSKRGQFGKGKEAVYKFVNHLEFVQIDTNYVVERAHHHAIAARVPDYKPEWLDQLQTNGRIVEAWTYATGYIPAHFFRFTLPVKESFLRRWKSLPQPEINSMNKVLDRIGREGPMMASDFENDRVTKSSGWWDWRPSKLALERLHLMGKLMTTRKENFQKVYDLVENILPRDLDMTMPTAEEYARYVIRRSLKGFGIAYMKEIVFSTRYTKSMVKEEIQKMIDEGEVCTVEIAGLKTSPLYMSAEYKKKKINLSDDAFILSPFDVLNVYRHRLRDFFNFDYQVECFVPKAKRKYGYFSLPISIGDAFVARMDSKADRKEQVLTIHNLHFESIKITKVVAAKISNAVKAFAKFNRCEEIVIEKSNNQALLKTIRATLS
jgi:uncharacterized protein YcaQ